MTHTIRARFVRRLTRPLFVCLAVSLGPAEAWGQAEGTSPIILSLPASTRALGLANTFLPFGGDPDAVFYQPAALRELNGANAAVQVYGASSVLATFSAGGSILGGDGAVGMQYLLYPSVAAGPPQLIGDLQADGPSGGGELVGSVGWSRELLGVRAGITGKLIEQRNGGARDAIGALDVGIIAEIGEFTMSAAALNLGSAPTVSIREASLPRAFVLGSAFETQVVGPLDVTGGAQVMVRRDSEVIPSGGLEARWWPIQGRTFVGRVGVRRAPEPGAQPFTFGAAFIADGFTLEYAFESLDGDGNAHRFGIRWR